MFWALVQDPLQPKKSFMRLAPVEWELALGSDIYYIKLIENERKQKERPKEDETF
jgi:hypothetical protein